MNKEELRNRLVMVLEEWDIENYGEPTNRLMLQGSGRYYWAIVHNDSNAIIIDKRAHFINKLTFQIRYFVGGWDVQWDRYKRRCATDRVFLDKDKIMDLGERFAAILGDD